MPGSVDTEFDRLFAFVDAAADGLFYKAYTYRRRGATCAIRAALGAQESYTGTHRFPYFRE